LCFAKAGGQLYQFKQQVFMQKEKPIVADFTAISEQALKKMFGKNVRI
jgi:hypothetical protein